MSHTISRHYLTIGRRRVHYRRAGDGPPLIMIHQSPRSSAEYEALMLDWAAHFTCIAPDTSGFGQSARLTKAHPDINDYADAVAEFIRALGINRAPAYGFHSGGIILITAMKRHPDLFTGVAAGGYPIWTDEERIIFGDAYLPPFEPDAYGTHLTWLWNRAIEQSWFFPWYDTRDATRLSVSHDNPLRVEAMVRDMLDSGDAYRLGYGAALSAPRDIPAPDAVTPPVLITAYNGDPLQAHLARIGEMPAGWRAYGVDTPAMHHAESLAFLKSHSSPAVTALAEDRNQGFVHITTADFNGLIHWRGQIGDGAISVPAPGRSIDLIEASGLAIDPPGHGLSDPWPGAPPTAWTAWQDVFDVLCRHFGAASVSCEAARQGDPDQLYPDLTPDRHGSHLTRAWNIIRARHFFDPWYEANAAHARRFDPGDLAPHRLAREHGALLQASAARAFQIALTAPKEEDDHVNP